MSERILRVNSEIQKAISEVIQSELKNPMIKGLITVTKVDTTQDLDQCKVYFYLSYYYWKDKGFFIKIEETDF